jgi:hypothetical protein
MRLSSYLNFIQEFKIKEVNTMLFNTYRKNLWSRSLDIIEGQIVKLPFIEEGYIWGSFVTKKPKPNDVDLICKVDPEKVNIVFRPANNIKEIEARKGFFSEDLNTWVDVIFVDGINSLYNYYFNLHKKKYPGSKPIKIFGEI